MTHEPDDPVETAPQRASAAEVLRAFLRLGCTSFGGPVAHLGYFQQEFVGRRRWVTQGAYAELVAIAQSLPGPASSQVGFALGLLRAGWLGGLAAWVGFTLPSAVLMLALAFGHAAMHGVLAGRMLHGLQLVAVAVVAQAVVAMQRSLAPDARRRLIALLGAAMVLWIHLQAATLLAIVVGAGAGLLVCREQDAVVDVGAVSLRVSQRMGFVALLAFVLLFVLTAFMTSASWWIFAAFYRTGALVFGGGHVVLPLLERAVVDRGWVSEPVFLSGYGALQAVPGPLFAFAAYLGAMVEPMQYRGVHALVALVAIFLPGLLLMAGVLPFWAKVRANAQLRAGLRGANASVVGVLAAALVWPLVPSSVHSWVDAAFVAVAFALLHVRHVQAWMVVVVAAALSVAVF